MIMIFNILWNTCWTWELVNCVKNPMVYSENKHKYYQAVVYFVGILLTATAFGLSQLHSMENNLICTMNEGIWYHVYVTAPLILSLLLNLVINFKYGSDKNLRTFDKNYDRFKMIFRWQRIYMFLWYVTYIPTIVYGFVQTELWTDLQAYGLLFSPIAILLVFSFSFYFNRKAYYMKMAKSGVVQSLLNKGNFSMKKVQESGDEQTNFKEVIRQNIVQKISSSLDIVYSKPEAPVMQRDPEEQKDDESEFEEHFFSDEEGYDPEQDQTEKQQLESSQGTGTVRHQTTLRKDQKGFGTKVKGMIDYFFDSSNVEEKVDSTFKYYGAKRVMKKVDLKSKYQIKKEAQNKKIYNIKLGESNQMYFLEEYAPRIYQNIRKILDIEDFKIADLFGKEAQPHLDIKISAGKGGAFFVKNKQDPSILIKSITPGEYEVLKNFTGNFYRHLLLHPDSLISPIIGVYTLSLAEDDSIEPISFMLMKSVFDTKLVSDHQKLMFFDLKGSTEGRRTLQETDVHVLKDMKTCDPKYLDDVLKDNDLADSINSILLEETEALSRQIKMDADFLCDSNMLDYSLLLFLVYDYGEDGQGFVKGTETRLPAANGMSNHVQYLQDKDGVSYARYVYFGVIDYITTYNLKKQLEVQVKSVLEHNPSAVKPPTYAQRFTDSMFRVIGHSA